MVKAPLQPPFKNCQAGASFVEPGNRLRCPPHRPGQGAWTLPAAGRRLSVECQDEEDRTGHFLHHCHLCSSLLAGHRSPGSVQKEEPTVLVLVTQI